MIPLIYLISSILLVTVSGSSFNSSFTPQHVKSLQKDTKELFDHAWNSYMKYGFPMDEVKPISCQGYGPNFMDPEDTMRNDALGNVSSTLLDNLDTLIILEKWQDVSMALDYLKSEKSTYFDSDVIVQVFETTIRSLGGLMSAHSILNDESLMESKQFKDISRAYDGFLLDMAHDLGVRLIPAFKTNSRIPVPRVNLKKGVKSVPYKLQRETCTSGATTPVLELTLLSKLTGDPQFEHYSQMAFWRLWNSRSSLDLLSMSISPLEQKWNDAISGIGASIDSFYEYCVKGAVLFDDDHMMETFKRSYRALMTHSVKGSVDEFTSLIFANIGTDNGLDATIWIDSLSAFWTGVQVLAGQVKDAIGSHLVFLKIFDYFESIPERWNCLLPEEAINKPPDVIGLEWYPLRPEFVESTYYLYRATRDPMYLQIGERVLKLFQTKYKARCGFKGLQDIRTGKFQDRMESFVLSETLKYLYLLFDEQNEVFLHSRKMDGKNWIFSTEGHPLWLDKPMKKEVQLSESLFESQDTPQKKFSIKNIFGVTKEVATINPKPEVKSIRSYELVDVFDSKFDKCELNPFVHNPQDFMKSSYYDMDNLFNIDATYSKYLYKPPYLSQTNIDGSYVELTPEFFSKYTQFNTSLTCPVQSNTNKLELFVGNKSEIVNSKVFHLPGENALFVESFNNVRVSLEFLEAGKVDVEYNYVSHDLIEQNNEVLIKEYDMRQKGEFPDIHGIHSDESNKDSLSHEDDHLDVLDTHKHNVHHDNHDPNLNDEKHQKDLTAKSAAKIGENETGEKEELLLYDVLLRITRINGVFVKPGTIIVTQPSTSKDGNITTKNSKLFMNGISVINVKVND